MTFPFGVVALDNLNSSLSSSPSIAVNMKVKSVSSGTVTLSGDVMTGGVLKKLVVTKATAYKPTSALSAHVAGPWHT